MATINLKLPKSLESFVAEQTAVEGHANPSDYILALLRRAKARENLEQKLLEGVQSGDGGEVTEAFWEDLRKQIHEPLSVRSKTRG